MLNRKIGFIGGGNMARAIAGGLLRGGMHATDIFIAEPLPERCAALRKELYGSFVTDDNQRVAAEADILLFAVKPQILRSVCEALADTVATKRPLIMSIAAGPRLADIERWLGGNLAVVRVMPNQPALVDRGISGMIANDRATADDRTVARRVMTAVGQAVWVQEESLIDAVTAVSGTGPAYFYLLIDIMIDAACRYGLDPDTARTLAIETARGAAALAHVEDESMKALIERVRSPGGTTTAAFERLDADGVRAIFGAAIDAARDRAAELGQADSN